MKAPDTSWAKALTHVARPSLHEAVEAFLAAHKASQEVFLSRAQISGPGPVPPQAEFLHDEAQHAWDLLAEGWTENLIPAYVREIGRDYVRPKVVHTPVAMNWDALDWSRGR